VNQADIDNQIIDQVLAGDQSLFSELVTRHKDYAFTIAYNILLSKEDAEEVAHDAFLKAFRNLSKFNRTAKFSTWLYRIVFNTAISAKRKVKVTKESIEKYYHFADEATSGLEEQDQKKYLTYALSQLSALDKMVLTLFYLKEHSIDEIAEIAEMNETTVKVRLHRARKRLAKELKNILKEEALSL